MVKNLEGLRANVIICLVDNGGIEVIRLYLTLEENGGLRLHCTCWSAPKMILED